MSKSHSTVRRKNQACMGDISRYLVKQPESDEDCVSTKVSVPCPDAAALPCSTCLGSTCNNSDCIYGEKDMVKASKNSKVCVAATDINPKSLDKISIYNNASKKKVKKPLLAIRNSQITDFFPVRRSNRKTLVCKMVERNQIIEDAILSGKEEGFEIKEYPNKGRGIITTKAFSRGDFVLEYFGELIDYEEAKKREEIYADKENVGCYMYYFKCRNKQYCIDATKESDRLGRLVNHSKKGNLRTRTFLIQDLPHLIFFASRDIDIGEELCYDYGDRRKVAVESHPWLAS